MFSEFREAVLETLKKEVPARAEDLVEPPEPKRFRGSGTSFREPPEGMGELGYPCFGLAKEQKKSPADIAKTLAVRLKTKTPISEVRAVGPYVNFFVDWNAFASSVKQASSKTWGSSSVGKNKTVIVEYSSPNVAKPMHAGHLMTTVVGDSIYRLLRAQGYKTVRINHIGDWGTQFGKLVVAYEKWGDEAALKKNPIKELVRVYVRFHEEAERNDALEEDARKAFALLEKGDKKLRATWKRFVELSLEEFKRTYAELGVDFDAWTGESFYEEMLGDVIEDALKKRIAEEEADGSVVIKFGDLPPMLIRKSDGSSLYATRDLATLRYRAAHYKFNKCVYVVGAQQTLHFQQLFAAVSRLGYADPQKCVHVPTGYINLPGGAMSTRKGTAILADEILEEAKRRAANVIEEKNPTIKNKNAVVNKVAMGAVKYTNLAQHRGKDVTFEWDKVVNLRGNSGPYLQYTYARASSILREGKAKKVKPKYEDANERRLLLKISKLPDAAEAAALNLTPHVVAVYLHELAELFNSFYENCHVLKEKEPVRSSRLLLVGAFRNTMGRGLELLGIEPLEEM
ncbi:MAG: arginine--tRNA ligase [Candidatus Aenigmatarchaeota archaeon]|nr:MAG: arginine--tRNA ligase [Candidatus Aenigmarchaeota archaeon]